MSIRVHVNWPWESWSSGPHDGADVEVFGTKLRVETRRGFKNRRLYAVKCECGWEKDTVVGVDGEIMRHLSNSHTETFFPAEGSVWKHAHNEEVHTVVMMAENFVMNKMEPPHGWMVVVQPEGDHPARLANLSSFHTTYTPVNAEQAEEGAEP